MKLQRTVSERKIVQINSFLIVHIDDFYLTILYRYIILNALRPFRGDL